MVTEREPRRFDDDDEDELKPLEPPWQMWLKRAVPVVIPILLVIVILNVWMLPNYVKKDEDIVNFQNVLATIDTLKSKIDELSDGSNELNSLRTEVNQLSDKVIEFDDTINKIDLSKYALKDSVPSNVTSEITTLKTQISSLQSRVDNIKVPGIEGLQSSIDSLKTTVDSLKTQVTALSDISNRVKLLEDSISAMNPDLSSIDIEFIPEGYFTWVSDNKSAYTDIMVMIKNNNDVDVSINEILIEFSSQNLDYPVLPPIIDAMVLSYRGNTKNAWFGNVVSFTMNVDRKIGVGKTIYEKLTFTIYDTDASLITQNYVSQLYLDPDIYLNKYSFN